MWLYFSKPTKHDGVGWFKSLKLWYDMYCFNFGRASDLCKVVNSTPKSQKQYLASYVKAFNQRHYIHKTLTNDSVT